ncbi:MAG: tyrosinase family protein [Rhodobacter sp.]|nr:tyrosinase family protein [Rhodobacter sp.]
MFDLAPRLRHGCALAMMGILGSTACLADPDLFIRDTITDAGAEPYTGPGPVYLSPDIWVRNDPDPNFAPYPFSTAAPPWTPLPHENPEYRDSKTSRPNYVYVRVQNRGDQPSTGTERLRLYQAKASTGLSWPASWVDNVGMTCGADRLLGIEISKPRRNAKTVSAAVRNAYRDALIAIGSDAAYQYSDGTQYFRKQNTVHQSPNPEHGNPAFLPWHREMMNRYEERLREANPLVTLLYWDFTEDPRIGPNLFNTSFMGTGNGTVAAPLVPLRPPTLTRNVGGSFTFGGVLTCDASLFESDATLNANGSYPPLADDIEGAPNHDCAHGYIGGFSGSTGQISSLSTAAEDPFFFMLHTNVDRQWANWQRQNADPARIDPVAVYGSDSSHSRINANMNPWSGGSGIPPWSGAASNKTAKHPSIVFPPIYDTAPLNIPVLQPGQSVVIEVPWYPPNVNNYNCAGQAGHFCLLARIETQTAAPFGMTFAEGMSVGTNTRNNNNIAWKNVTIVDNVLDPALLRLVTGTTIRNIFGREAIFEILLWDRTEKRQFLLPEFARVSLALPKEVVERLRERGARIEDFEVVRDDATGQVLLQIAGKAPRFSLPMKPGEAITAELRVDLQDKEPPRELLVEPFHYDLEQRLDLPAAFFGTRGEAAVEVGGVRFTLDILQALKNREAQDALVEIADLSIELSPEGPGLPVEAAAPVPAVPHLSVGEPLNVRISRAGDGGALRALSLELDGEPVADVEGVEGLTETLSFDAPGVHAIVTRAIDENGEITERRTRVLVSENIPPNAVILSPVSGDVVKLGAPVDVSVEVAAAFARDITEVALYVKEGDVVATGFNLVESDGFPPVDSAEGPGPHTLSFTPERTGMHMLQIGAVDDNGIVGVSGHAMVMVAE